ncbi:tRNA pseudouridine(55) synthase TruB [Mycoplasmopsis pullorum]|uniref:tRNA pseudouridine(55) synthase TruB n=1 Tax=Mycoplasmopsis pullorum TaxID=48003 RepID=UPI00111B2ABF|nr:tRNA pseudouridine(55) synthase TruB [Mycoplasmopsis pullorum]TNK84063.1 tRNA pseudouridine(55) synthase TruB [Mycoplasmopsis pullorum]TNK91867.1 tRNA pseudouridine(55) synthase TruB [Mycoplasmopsis pullorum]
MFYLIKKNKDISSFSAIRQFAKEHGIKKIGHTGTLDPLATGLLLVASDEDTKLIQYIDNKIKGYIVEGQFGYSTDSYDITGNVTNQVDSVVDLETLNQQLLKLSRIDFQYPPVFSAKKINGKKAYDLARQNIHVEMKKQKIKVFDYKLLHFNQETQKFKIYFKVSEGTYIRTLVHDLGLMCNSLGTMLELDRCEIGELSSNLLGEDDYKKIEYSQLFKLPTYSFSKKDYLFLKDGRNIIINEPDGIYLLINSQNEVAGILEVNNYVGKAKKMFLKRLSVYE